MRHDDRELFQTVVARRLMRLFLLCALLPIVALGVTAYLHVGGQLRDQALARLASESKGAGMTIFERLEMVESRLRSAAPLVLASGLEAMAQLPAGVTGVIVAGGKESEAGEPVVPPETMTVRQRRHLASGEPVLQVVADRLPHVLLGLALDPMHLDAGVLWAKLDPPYLWSSEEEYKLLPEGVEMCVFSDQGSIISCPYGPATVSEAMRPGAAGSQETGRTWKVSGETFLGADWTMFLGFKYAAPSWTIVLGEPRSQVYAPLDRFKRTFPLVLLLALMIVAWVSHRQVRMSMKPLAALTAGTEQITQQRFDTIVAIESGDEFEDLAGSFNAMARQLGKQFNTLTVRGQIDRAVLSELDRGHIVDTVLERANQALGCSRLAMALKIDGADTPRWRVVTIKEGRREEHDLVIAPEELEELLGRTDGLVLNGGDGPRSYLSPWRAGSQDPVLVMPMMWKNEVNALIALEYAGRDAIDADQTEARQLADQISVALSNAGLVQELDSLSSGALTALARTIDANSPWTAGHSERVTTVALAIASEIGLPQENLDTLYRGGLLHDIGKIAVPPSILDKPAKLTDEEFEIVKQHPSTGATILAPIKAYADTIPIVRHHHEKLDGTGYPDGLAGDEIPYLARLVCVADVYDALTSERPYRPGWSSSKAAGFLLDGAGRLFDPGITAAFNSALVGGRLARDPSATLETAASLSPIRNGHRPAELHNAIGPALRMASSDI